MMFCAVSRAVSSVSAVMSNLMACAPKASANVSSISTINITPIKYGLFCFKNLDFIFNFFV